MLFLHVAVDDPDDPVLDHHGDADHRDDALLPGHVGVHVARLPGHVEDRYGPPLRHHPPGDRLAYLQVRLVDVLLAQALGGRDHQLLLLLIEEHDGADLRTHYLGGHGDDELEYFFQVIVG